MKPKKIIAEFKYHSPTLNEELLITVVGYRTDEELDSDESHIEDSFLQIDRLIFPVGHYEDEFEQDEIDVIEELAYQKLSEEE